MFEKITPEQAGVSSDQVTKFIKAIKARQFFTHGILMMKDGKIFAEEYWKPFHKDFCHRMYSQTKSFVGVAIGLLLEEGKLSLQDKIADHFPEKIDGELNPYLAEQTIRDMLTMCTCGQPGNWFVSSDPDRTHYYFNHDGDRRPSGGYFEYDSAGSQVLSSLVEKLSGKTLLDYLKEKLFNRMGTFQTATILQTPNGDSWGDSAMVCTLRDMASFAQLVMNYGTWEGERLMNEEYLREATAKQVDNRESAHYGVYRTGYGYQIWRTERNGFAFLGMGHQITMCFPDKNVLFTYYSDNQGDGNIGRELMGGNFIDMILDEMQDTPLPENKAAQKRYRAMTKHLELRAVQGQEDSPFRQELNGTKYICQPNSMGIKEFTFRFTSAKKGKFCYTNAQGKKTIPFGVNHNVFGKFPQLGYANDKGRVATQDGFMYDDAVSLAWTEDKKLLLCVQIIDRYFGNFSVVFAFKDDIATAHFNKAAEAFLNEYQGTLIAKKA